MIVNGVGTINHTIGIRRIPKPPHIGSGFLQHRSTRRINEAMLLSSQTEVHFIDIMCTDITNSIKYTLKLLARSS